MTNEGYRPDPYDSRERYNPRGDPRRAAYEAFAGPSHANVALYLILSIFTVGLFNLYWNWRQMQACNALLSRQEFSWIRWILFCLLTFGIYHFYYQYKMGAAINEIQEIVGVHVTEGLPVLSLVATLVGFGIVTDCIHQYELNKVEVEREMGAGV